MGRYLSAYSEGMIDRNIRGMSVWAPWYTLHKIFSGLIDQYLYADNAQALDVACKDGGLGVCETENHSRKRRAAR